MGLWNDMFCSERFQIRIRHLCTEFVIVIMPLSGYSRVPFHTEMQGMTSSRTVGVVSHACAGAVTETKLNLGEISPSFFSCISQSSYKIDPEVEIV